MADLTVKQVLQRLGKDILNWVKTNCVDNLVSTSKNLPLSANQGRVLKEGQDAINQSLESNILCGTCYESNDILFSCKNWDNGLYVIYNTRGTGNICEFLFKDGSRVGMTNIAPQKHTVDGYNITFYTDSYYSTVRAHKII